MKSLLIIAAMFAAGSACALSVKGVVPVTINTTNGVFSSSVSVTAGGMSISTSATATNPALFVDPTNGRIGLGTNVPGSLLDVRGTTIFRGDTSIDEGVSASPNLDFLQNGTVRGRLSYENGSTALALSVNSVSQVSINSAGLTATYGVVAATISVPGSVITSTTAVFNGGNVGIGTTSPGFLLDVRGVAVSSGVVDASDAAAGRVGEYLLSGAGTDRLPATNEATSVSTLTLTAGDWDVTATGWFVTGATSDINYINWSISTAANTIQSNIPGCQVKDERVFSVSGQNAYNLGPRRVSVNTSTPVYLVCNAKYSVAGGAICYGDGSRMSARRVR